MIRRALLRSWPALTRFYGLRPWECSSLTMDELNEYLRQLDDHNRRMAEQHRQQQRGR